MPKLSIVIATRDRPFQCASALKHLARSTRTDFEVIVADDSSDPAPLAEAISALSDSRFRRIAPAASPRGVAANWQRGLDHAHGEWVTVIGDDDYVDPELAQLLATIEKAVANADAVAWSRMHYTWPSARDGNFVVPVSAASHLRHVAQKEALQKLFFWEGAGDRPAIAFGLHHGAVRRTLLERAAQSFGGPGFSYPMPDMESICRTVMVAEAMVWFDRPMSVIGTSVASVAGALRAPRIGDKLMADFLTDGAEDLPPADFPFPLTAGIAAATARTIEAFKADHGIALAGWEENFVKACVKDCELTTNRRAFNERREAYAAAFKAWRGGAYRKLFKPNFKEQSRAPSYRGFFEDRIYISDGIGGAASAAEFYASVNPVFFPIDVMEQRLLGS